MHIADRVCMCVVTEKHDEREKERERQWIGEGEGTGTRDVLLRERSGGRGICNESVITRACTYPMIFCLYVCACYLAYGWAYTCMGVYI